MPLNKNLQKLDGNFSITEKLHTYIRNPDWGYGFREVEQGLLGIANDGYPADVQSDIGGKRGSSALWRFLSASTEDLGDQIYERISRFITNLHDIDTCELHSLASYAQELGYEGNLDYLTFTYPIEIYNLLNIFSVDKNVIFETNEILNDTQLSAVFPTLSAMPSGAAGHNVMSGFVKNMEGLAPSVSALSSTAFSDEEWARVVALSGNALSGSLYETSGYLLGYDFIPSGNYVGYIDQSLFSCLSSFVYLRYRYEEYQEEQNLATSASLADTSGYVWQHITDQLYGTDLYKDQNNIDNSIIELKLRLGLPLFFNEKKYVDQIEAGVATLLDFSASEQLILQEEITRRSKVIAHQLPIQRYKADREKKVVEYFRFIENFNQIDPDIYFKIDPIDNTKLQLSGTHSSGMLTISACEFYIDNDYITAVTKSLRNIALKTFYFRQSLRLLAQKHSLKGTSTLIEVAIKELFDKFVFDSYSTWRYTNPVPSSSVQMMFDVKKLSNFNVDVVEYWDSTEYMNISALTDYPATKFNEEESTVNERFWTNEESFSETFTNPEISAFYMRLGLIAPSSITPDNYINYLSGFFDRIYNSAALSAYNTSSACSFDYVSADSLSGGYLDDSVFDSVSGGLDNWALTGTINYNDDFKPHVSGVASMRASSAFSIITTAAVSSITGSIDGYTPSGILWTSSTTSTPTVSSFDLTGSISNLLFWTDISGVSQIYGDFTGVSVPSGFALTSKVYSNLGTPLSFIDEYSTVFYRNTGTPVGITPYANYKNKTHPSYAIHPFVRRLIEAEKDTLISLENIFSEILETVHGDFGELQYRIDEYGNTINSWMSQNVEYGCYSTAYETNTNLDYTDEVNKNIGIDGPWNFNALNSFVADPSAFILSVSGGTNEYYDNIDLTLDEKVRIARQLATVSGDVSGTTCIRGLQSYVIYQYGVDTYENNYILFKSDKEFDTQGSIWVRMKNHPLALPFSSVSGQEHYAGDCGQTSEMSQIDTSAHKAFQTCVNEAYDFGIFGPWIWVTHSDNIESQVSIGNLVQVDNALSVQRDLNHNFEGFNLSGQTRHYAGVYTNAGAMTLVSVSADRYLATLPISPADPSYHLAIMIFDSFHPDDGVSTYFRTVPVHYDTFIAKIRWLYVLAGGGYYILAPPYNYYLLNDPDNPWDGTYRNIWRLTHNKNMLTVGYEHTSSVSGDNQIENIFGDKPLSSYYNLHQCAGTVSATEVVVPFPNNGMTLMQFELEDVIEVADEAAVIYTMPFARLRNVPLFEEPTTVNNFNTLTALTEYGNKGRYYIELFSDKWPVSGAGIRHGKFSIDGTQYICFIDFDEYVVYENYPLRSTYLGNAVHTEDSVVIVDESLPTETSAWKAEFSILDLATSGLRIWHEFAGEVNKVLSGYSDDLTKIHSFQYLGRSAFAVSSFAP